MYVARQAAVKKKYGLWVTAAEKAAMLRVLGSCPGLRLPPPGSQPTLASNTGGSDPYAVPAGSTNVVTTPTPKNGSKLDPQFRTCRAAKAAGYGPYYRGVDPEYDWYVDRDGDGIVCEKGGSN